MTDTTHSNGSSFQLTCACQIIPPRESCSFPQDSDDNGFSYYHETFSVFEGLSEFRALQHHCSLLTFFGAAWSLVLRYYVGQSDVAFDYITADHRGARMYTASGIVKGDETIKEFTGAFDRAFEDKSSRCVCPRIPRKKHPTSVRPFNTTVIFNLVGVTESESADLVSNGSILELQLFLNQDLETFKCLISYDRYAVSINRVAEIATSLRSFIRTSVRHFDRPISKINLNSTNQRDRFDTRLQNTPAPIGKFFHDQIEKFASISPSALAIRSWDRNFTFEELKQQSDRLAHHLRALGVGLNTIVPILSIKCGWVPIAILAILKAGAAFLLLDPSHPPERLQMLISRVNPKVVVCSDCPDAVEQIVFPTIERRVLISSISDLAEVPEDTECFKMLDTTLPAYIVFTSGSTGIPKAVVISHDAIVLATKSFGKAIGLSRSCNVLQFSAHSFDPSIAELCSTLVFGGTVCIPSEEERLDDVAGCIRRMDVTRCFITPTVASLLNIDEVPSLTDLLLGGEQLRSSDIEKWTHHVRLYNGYGPTEASILCAIKKISSRRTDPKHVGLPVGCSAWIVNYDDDRILCPDGTAGELMIMGSIVGSEYLNDPGKTAKSFIQQPNWFLDKTFRRSRNRHRLYKTGDSAYMKPDGTLMIIGRRDNQIKLHGQRIELGEVEAQLVQVLPKGSNVVVDVISPGNEESNKQLVAFVVLPQEDDDVALGVEAFDMSLLPLLDKEIRLPLQERLPQYMCPSVYIPIAKIPETTSNKADRKALKALGSSKTVLQIAAYNGIERIYTYPVTREEKLMQKFWSEIVKLEPSEISASDNFFILGGDSIKAIKLVKVAQTAGLSISYQDVFKSPTLSELALKMQRIGGAEADVIEPFSTLTLRADCEDLMFVVEKAGINRGDVEDYYMSTAEQDRMIRQTLVYKDSHIIPFPFQLGPEIDLPMFKRAWERLVAALPIFRTRLVEMTPENSLQVVIKEKIQWQELNGGIEDGKPLVIGFGKPLTSWAISSNEQDGKEKFFIMYCHHALLDGWSLNLLWNALANAYKDDKEPVFKCSMNSLAKFFAERNHRDSEIFWESRLKGAKPSTFLNMPSEEYVPYQTDRREDKVILDKFPTSSFTMSTIIQVAYAITLWSYEHEHIDDDILADPTNAVKDVVFRTTGTGRAQQIPGIQELIGPVLTSYPVRIQSSTYETITELLEHVQNQASEAVEHEYYGIEQIKKLCKSKHGIVCDSNSPYLIIQADIPVELLKGMIRLPTPWVPSQTPFSVCCILMPDGVKIATGLDKNVISKEKVDGFLEFFGIALKGIVELLNEGEATVGQVLSDWEDEYEYELDKADEGAEDKGADDENDVVGEDMIEDEE